MIVEGRFKELFKVPCDELLEFALNEYDRLKPYLPEARGEGKIVGMIKLCKFPVGSPMLTTWEMAGQQFKDIVAAVEEYYNGKVEEATIAKVEPGGIIPAHSDDVPFCHMTHRVHVPLKTNDRVYFTMGAELMQMLDIGMATELDDICMHSVINGGDEERIHLIMDVSENEL